LHGALRHTHAQRAGKHLVEQQALVEGQRAPRVHHHGPAQVRLAAGDGQQALLDPGVQRDVLGGLGRIVQQQGQGLAQVTHLVVAVLHQPVRQAALFGDPFAQLARAGDAAELAA